MKHIILFFLFTTPAFADDAECLAKTLYAEARGESLEGIIAVGNTVMNRADEREQSVCEVTRRGYTRKHIPEKVKPAFMMVARALISGEIGDVTRHADSFNRGKKPGNDGQITRVIGNHVFYIAMR